MLESHINEVLDTEGFLFADIFDVIDEDSARARLARRIVIRYTVQSRVSVDIYYTPRCRQYTD